MKRKRLVFVLICFVGLIMIGCAKQDEFPVLKGPYLGQKPPGMTPEIFAPGIVSTKEYSEGGITFSPDGDAIYFSRSNHNLSTWGIMVSRKTGQRWTKPEVAPFSGQHIDFEPHVSPNGKRLFFNRFDANDTTIQDGIWMTQKSKDGWGEPIFVGKGMNATSTLDGTVYVTDRSRPYEEQGIVKTRVIDNRFAPFEWQEGGVNASAPERKAGRHPFISPDESFIIFDSYKKGTDDTGRLFVCFRHEDGTWSQAIDLGDEINFAPVVCASVSPDGKYLFFCSHRGHPNKKCDIYWVDAKVIEELKPEASK